MAVFQHGRQTAVRRVPGRSTRMSKEAEKSNEKTSESQWWTPRTVNPRIRRKQPRNYDRRQKGATTNARRLHAHNASSKHALAQVHERTQTPDGCTGASAPQKHCWARGNAHIGECTGVCAQQFRGPSREHERSLLLFNYIEKGQHFLVQTDRNFRVVQQRSLN